MVTPAFALADTSAVVVNDLVTVAQDDALRQLTAVLDQDPLYVTDVLLETVPQIITPYAVIATQLGATAYEDLRELERVDGSFRASTIEAPSIDRIDALVRWAVGPLFGQSESTVGMLLGGGMQKILTNSYRDTISINSEADPACRGWERVPAAGSCAFCAMVSGNVYKTKTSADGFHDFCRCKVLPLFGSNRTLDDYPEYMRTDMAAYETAKKTIDSRMQLNSKIVTRKDGSKTSKQFWVDELTGQTVNSKQRTKLYLAEMRTLRGGSA